MCHTLQTESSQLQGHIQRDYHLDVCACWRSDHTLSVGWTVTQWVLIRASGVDGNSCAVSCVLYRACVGQMGMNYKLLKYSSYSSIVLNCIGCDACHTTVSDARFKTMLWPQRGTTASVGAKCGKWACIGTCQQCFKREEKSNTPSLSLLRHPSYRQTVLVKTLSHPCKYGPYRGQQHFDEPRTTTLFAGAVKQKGEDSMFSTNLGHELCRD